MYISHPHHQTVQWVKRRLNDQIAVGRFAMVRIPSYKSRVTGRNSSEHFYSWTCRFDFKEISYQN